MKRKIQKFDSGAIRDTQIGKGRYDLISPFAMRDIALVNEFGARRYSARNYEKGIPLSRFFDSAMRHSFKELMGCDDEDNAARAAWNWLAYLHMRALIRMGLVPKHLNDMPKYYKRRDEKGWADYLNGKKEP